MIKGRPRALLNPPNFTKTIEVFESSNNTEPIRFKLKLLLLYGTFLSTEDSHYNYDYHIDSNRSLQIT